MWKSCPRWTSSSGKSNFIVIPVDGLILYLSHTCDNWCSRTIVLLSYNISPLCDVAQTSDCGVYSFLTLNISPLCDVAQTSDCGTHCHLYSNMSPLCGVGLAPDCGIVNLVHLSRRRFRPSFGLQLFHWDFGRITAWLPFYLSCSAFSLSECAFLICSCASCLHLLYLMSKLSCEYFHSTHLACWFGQMLTKAISWMKSLIARPMPRGVPVSPARSRILVTCIVYASATRNKSPRASLRRSKSCSLHESYHSLRGDISTTVIIVS